MYIVCQLKNVTIYSGKYHASQQGRIKVGFGAVTNDGLNIGKNRSRFVFRRQTCNLFVNGAERLPSAILSKLRRYVILIQSNLAISGPGFSHCEGISEVK